jgi:hypothetical protein
MDKVNVVVTMDCEPTLETTHPTATGPRDFAQSERAITGYFEIAKSYGFPVTYFVHPETIIAQADLFKDLKSQGACIGLHMHPWKYSQCYYGGKRYLAHYGDLSEAEQFSILSESIALYREAMGERPLYFRPGTFSANDAVYSVLTRLGFRGGSVSAPGRVFTQIRSIWSQAELDPHRAHPHFRQIAGDLEFGNMPMSADVSRLLTQKDGRQRYADLRPDVDWPGAFGISYRTIAENMLSQIMERAPAVPVMNTISHNHFEYRDPTQAPCERYKVMLDEIAGACERAGVQAVGTTVDDIVEQVLAVPATPDSFAFI